MPASPDPKRRLHPFKARAPRDAETKTTAYAELYAISNFSFLRGASHPDELVETAAELGYHALALTDASSLAGIVRAHTAASDRGVSLIVGAEVDTEDRGRLVLLATDRDAYGRLSRLLTVGRTRGRKGECVLRALDVENHRDGLLALAVVPESALAPRASRTHLAATLPTIHAWREIFDDRLWLAAPLHDGPDDIGRLARFEWLEKETRIPLTAAGAIDAHAGSRRPLRDTMTAIRHGCRVDELGHRLPAEGCHPLRTLEDLSRIHAARPDLMRTSVAIADRCTFSLDQLQYEYPDEVQGRDLRSLTFEGAARRWPDGVPSTVTTMLEHELELIEEMRYEGYFLTVYDLVRYARSRGILCQGRGSAANSAVCYVLGITAVDPSRLDMLFERFVSRDRDEPPDIDVDFEHERREEVIQYVYERYGRRRAALAATVITYRGRSAVRDVGKALGLALDQTEKLARNLHHWHIEDLAEERLVEIGLDPDDPLLGRVIEISRSLHGFPRHLSQHVGGMVITRGRLDELCPIENAAMSGRTVIQWDKDDLDAVGLLKVDCLALGMLTAIHRTFDLIAAVRGRRLDLATVPAEDPAVYEMAGRADTIGVFQIESRAQMAMLPRFKPRRFYDLVIEVAIVRPGPIQGGMVHPYLRRRAGLEEPHYPSEELRDVLAKTLGVPIFQEQVMKLAMVAAGFTPGEADLLRRAMGAWRRPGLIGRFRRKLIDGMLERGYDGAFAEAVFKQIRGFGEYGFPESHAASFALLTYVSLWLKRFEPAAFTCALLNSQPMGFYAPAQLVACARRHGVPVRPVDVRRSEYACTLETDGLPPLTPCPDDPELPPEEYGAGGPALRLGLSMVKGLSRATADRVVTERSRAAFTGIEDLMRRVEPGRREASILADSGAFDGFGGHRREAWWRASGEFAHAPLFPVDVLREETPDLPTPNVAERVLADYGRTGLSLEAHPMRLLRGEMRRLGVTDSRTLAGSARREPVTVAGIVICRQRPATASGVMFVTLEDEHGHINVIVRLREQERFRVPLLNGSLLLMKGQVERTESVVHVLIGFIRDLSDRLRGLPARSRDFH